MKNDTRLRKLKMQAEYAGNGTILDVGFAANPNPFLKNVAGIDIVLPQNKPDNYGDIVACNLNTDDLPFADESFDALIAGDVIEHLENPSHFLREANRVLKPDGKLVISTPQANDWWVACHNWFFRRLIKDPDQGEHLQNWTFLDMTRLLKKNGFTTESIEGFVMRFPFISLRIPVRRFPALSWQVFYIAKKTHEPNKQVLVHVNDKWQSI